MRVKLYVPVQRRHSDGVRVQAGSVVREPAIQHIANLRKKQEENSNNVAILEEMHVVQVFYIHIKFGTTYLVVELDGEVADEHEGQADGAHDGPDQLLAVVELTARIKESRGVG